MAQQFTLTMTKAIELNWNVTDETPDTHITALEKIGMVRALTMIRTGVEEGELHERIRLPKSDPGDDVSYTGRWSLITSSARYWPELKRGFIASANEMVKRFTGAEWVPGDFLACVNQLTVPAIKAVQDWFVAHPFDVDTLKPLHGNLDYFNVDIAQVERPYAAITQGSYNTLEKGRYDLYLTPGGAVVTFGNADGIFALMPVEKTTAETIINAQPNSGDRL